MPGPVRNRIAQVATIAAVVTPVCLALLALGRMPAVARFASPSYAVAMWGALQLASFLGWGSLVNAVAAPARRFDVGVRMALGASAFLAQGGLMAMLGLVSRSTIHGAVAIGLIGWGVSTWRQRREAARSWQRLGLFVTRFPLPGLLIGVLLLAVAIQFCSAAQPGETFNLWDDNVAYFQFARKLLDTGSLIEPFSLRRILSFGGQSYLHAVALVYSPVLHIHIVDRGVFFVIACALAVGVLRERPRQGRFAAILALTLLVSLPDTRANTSSQMTGAALLFALFRIVQGPYLRGATRLGGPVMIGLLSVAAFTLRQNYIVPVAVFLAVSTLIRLRRTPPEEKMRVISDAVRIIGASAVLLLPWAILAYRSSGTFLFPLMKGNFRPEFGMLQAKSEMTQTAQFILKNTFFDLPVHTFSLFVVAAAVVSDKRTRAPLPAFVIGAVVGGLALVATFQRAELSDIGRYFYAMHVSMVLAIVVDLLPRAMPRTGRDLLVGAMLALSATLLHLVEVKAPTLANYDKWINGLKAFADPPNPPAHRNPVYAALQASVPAGASLVVMVDDPYLLDFARNRVFNLDIPGAVSPPPGMPQFQGEEPVAAYLLARGLRYLAFAKDDSSRLLYLRAHWERTLRDSANALYRSQAPFYLDTFSSFRALAGTRKRLFDSHGMLVLDLAERRPAPP